MDTQKRSLFQIGDDLLAIEQLMSSVDGDVTDPAVEAAITAWMAEFQTNQAEKAEGYYFLLRKWESEKAAAKAEAEQYAKYAKVRENRIVALKNRMKVYMETTAQVKIETATGHAFAIQANGGVVPMAIQADVRPETLDPKYQRVTIEVNTETVRKALEAGEELPFACLGQRGTQLRIR